MKQFYLYSATGNSFHPVSAPADAVIITEEQHLGLFSSQSGGKAIKPGKQGYPINVERGKSYEIWDQKTEGWIIDDELYQKYVEEEQAQRLQQKKDDLDIIETKITRLERIKKRTETEEQELDALIEQSTALFRKIKATEKEKLNDRNA